MIGESPVVDRAITIKKRVDAARGRARLVITERWTDANGVQGAAQKKWVYRVRVMARQATPISADAMEKVMKHITDEPIESIRGLSKKCTMRGSHFMEHHYTLFCITYLHEVVIKVSR